MQNFRSGVYTSFTINPIYSGLKNREIGLIAVCDKLDVINEHIVVNSLAQARQIFGEASNSNEVMTLLKAIFMNNSSKVNVIAIPNNSTQNYKNALDLILQTDAYILCFGVVDNDFLQYLQSKLEESENNGKEKIAVISSSQVEQAKDISDINDKRILVAFPKIIIKDFDVNLSSVILASMISNLRDISSNLNGATILPEFMLTEKFDDDTIGELINLGICVFENQNNIIELIRAVTTKTLDTDGNKDYTYKNLSTVLITDIVIPDIRKLLKNKLLNADNSLSSLNSIMALIVDRLDFYVDMNYISSYQKPNIYLSDEDETVCFVELNFTIVQGVYQVYLNVQVSV